MVKKKAEGSVFMVFNICICFLLLLWSASAVSNAVNTFTLRDYNGDSVVSEGGRFELGFFTPHGSSGTRSRRYVGIWYHRLTPEVVVWVANRNQPLSNNNGIFTIKNGNLAVLRSDGTQLWSTDIHVSSDNITVELMASGNLVLKELGDNTTTTLWQSFLNPTDTFLPGMNMTDDLKLTSWKGEDDPSEGNFTFQKDLKSLYIIERHSARYWVSKEVWQKFFPDAETDDMITRVVDLISKSPRNLNASNYIIHFQDHALNYYYTRLVMSFSGEIQYLARDTVNEKWEFIWREPENKCSVLTACGNFATCRSKTVHSCKCLPGFEPKSKNKWNSGDYSDGCQRKTEICPKEMDQTRDFLAITMNVRKTSNIVKADNKKTCRTKCLESCACQAYSEVMANNRNDSSACVIWEEELQNIWEEGLQNDWPDFGHGGDVYVRFKHSDIEYTELDCEACASNIVPYPLSTGTECGDPTYGNFTCINIFRGLVFYPSADSGYVVTNIEPQLNTFTIRTNGSICSGIDTDEIQKLLKLENSSTFKVSSDCDPNFNEVDIQWAKPLEPICDSPKDCTHWPNSICNSSTDGRMRCLCHSSLRWTGTGCHKPQEAGLNPPDPKQRSIRVGIVVSVTIAGLIAISCFVSYIYNKRRKLQNKKEQRTEVWGNQEMTRLYESEKRVRDFMSPGMFGENDRKAIEVPVFDLQTILIATDNFSEANKIGRGGFGTVYKGLFPEGLEIAIKRLSQGSSQGVDEFKNEAILIAKLQHRNLVRLLGYCVSGEEKMLVYEYMPNKSLDFFIFDPTQCLLVNWEMRFNIIMGIARGLLYLHEDSRLRIIHRDMKTSNVLLNAEMNPKISDFGLARIFDGNQTEAITKRVVGTYGYMSPEYAMDGTFSVKSDVFSFGIVVLEIVSGRRNTGFYQSKEALNLLGYVWKLWREKRALEIAEVGVRESCNPNEVVKCVAVGLLCVEEDPNDRPTMSNVAFMLSSGSDPASLPDPKRPAFVDKKLCPSTSTASATSSMGFKQEIESNDCSLLEPR